MFCTKCGEEIPEGARFCTSCGASLDEVVEISEVEDVAEGLDPTEGIEPAGSEDVIAASCEYCGTPLEEGETVCSNCGAPITVPEEPVEGIEADAIAIDEESVVENVVIDSMEVPNEELLDGASIADNAVAQPVMPPASSTMSSGSANNALKKTIIVVACVVVLVCFGIVALVLTTCSSSDVSVDENAFPDSAVRIAVADQVDADGDGILSTAEREAVTGLSLINGEVQFGLNDASVKATNITGISTSNAKRDLTLSMFPNLRTFVAPAAGLNDLDLKGNGQLRYVDVRGNDLQSIDLTANKDIKTLFCDDSVKIEGIDENILYFTDLLVSANQSEAEGSTGPYSIDIIYDTNGRPIVRKSDVDTKEYEYDDRGRLIRASVPDNVRATQTYAYESTGELREYIWAHGMRMGVGTVVEEDFAYDDFGRILDEHSKEGGIPGTVGTFAYADDDTLHPSSFEDDATGISEEYAFDSDGRLTSVQRNVTGGQRIASITYATSGAVSAVSSDEYGGLTVSYDGQGNPVSATFEDLMTALPSCDVRFACNADGYIIQVDSSLQENADYRHTLVFDYVKMVGRYDDRALLRFVPSFEPMLSIMLWIHPVVVPFDKAFFSSLGDSAYDPMLYGCTVYELGPEFVSLRNAGLFPSVLTNENELKLAAWDLAHWKDGLELD